ncbi:hypothetical protein HY745_13350 [Candidatus Desantisbacteria bacterium]|nr:hypothetical protein [Candidatus Desantisbacteria bacterium]
MIRKKIDNSGYNQLNLFDIIDRLSHEEKSTTTKAGTFNIDVRVRALLSDALKQCTYSREYIAARMSELTGIEITKSQLDSWTAESKEQHRFPFAYSAAFCDATGSLEILKLVVEMVGGYLLKGEDALYTELGRIKKNKKELAEKEKLINQTLEQFKLKRK